MRRPARVGLVLLLAAFAIAACKPVEYHGTAVDPPLLEPELSGTNWNGEAFSLDDLSGRLVVLFFGYSSCPDICPLTLSRMKQVHEALGERADEVAMVFVSVDPGRDDVAQLARYVPAFDPDFYGVHVDEEQLEKVTREIGVFVQRQEPTGEGPDAFYAVDHTTSLFVLDREGGLRLYVSHALGPEELLEDLEQMLDS